MAGEPHLWQPDDVVAGKYRLVRVLGEGGMGIVYEARHVKLRQRLAIKMVRPSLAVRHNVVLRFEREARAAALLRNAHAAKVIDVDATSDGVPYIVMEFLEGRSLSSLLESRGRLPVEEVIGWVLETCCAIAEAHDQGIVHRDLKPSNLFLASESDRSIVKVLDFGISKLADESDASLTTSQVMLGTPNYMSPEQVRSAREVDGRTDVWSLGVILYELLTGKLPFSGATPSAVLAAIVADPVTSTTALRPDIPHELDAVVLKALSKRAEDRFASVRELASALVPFSQMDAYVTAEVAQLLKRASHAPTLASAENAELRAAAAAPTAPGWSRITAATAKPRSTLVLAAMGVVAVIGWYAQSAFQGRAAPEAAAPVAPSPAIVAASSPIAPAVAASIHPEPPPSASEVAPPSAAAAQSAVADAGSPGAAVSPGPRKVRQKVAAPSVDRAPVPPPPPSSNPLHL